MKVHSKEIALPELMRRVGRLDQIAGVRLLELADGGGRGSRILDFRTAAGLRFEVLVDRGFDIGGCDYRGIPIAWQSAVGPSAPWFAEQGGLGWLRNFGGGLLTTCGFEHTLFPAEEDGSRFAYAANDTVTFGLHGRISNRPARLSGYGMATVDGRDVLWAEAEVEQAAVYGEALRLTRRIQVAIDGSAIAIVDRVVNFGYAVTPTMVLYHINLGYPLVDEGAQVVMDVEFARAGDGTSPPAGYLTVDAPSPLAPEQGFEHTLVPDSRGWASAALHNERLGIGFKESHDQATLPYNLLWRQLRDGMYVIGLEPCSVPIEGRISAPGVGVPFNLAPGDAREYRVTLEVYPV